MIDRDITGRLEELGIRYAVIGAVGLAAHGWSRYTADVDLLTLERRVLEPATWAGLPVPEIRTGGPDDPLVGLVRFDAEVVHDVIVGRGHAAHVAVDTAVRHSTLACPVATPLALVLLKLEAGGPQDRHDILGLVTAQRDLNGASWLSDVAAHVTSLSPEARALWRALAPAVGAP